MSWKTVKKALNSTLCTEKFQSLDQMIVGQKRFVASDTPIASVSSYSMNSTEWETVVKFVPKIPGIIKGVFNLDSSGYSSVTGYFRVQEDGTTVYSVTDSSANDFEFLLNISAEKEYTFDISASASDSATIKNFVLSGDIVDSNWFTLEIFDA